MPTKLKSHRLFNIRLLPMDLARLVCAVLVPFFRIKRLTPEGGRYRDKVKGGAIIAANHTSFTDPFIVGVTFWYRRLHFLVAEVVMQGRFRPGLLKGAGAIKIDRNATDIEAINRSVGVLKEGYLLSVFPQGAIHKEDDVDNIKSGAVLMALKANVPIIPMHIRQRAHWYDRQTVVIGKAICPAEICKKKLPSTADIANITDILAKELARCKLTDTEVQL